MWDAGMQFCILSNKLDICILLITNSEELDIVFTYNTMILIQRKYFDVGFICRNIWLFIIQLLFM